MYFQVWWCRSRTALAFCLLVAVAGPGTCSPDVYKYQVVKAYPHDSKSFTQGLVYAGGNTMYESAGQYGESNVREVDLSTGAVRKQTANEKGVFAEGLAMLGGTLHQIAWQTNQGFSYDAGTLKETGRFKTPLKDGWGLAATTDTEMVLSDGSSKLHFLDPNWKLKRSVEVKDNGVAIPLLNELEYVDGEVWANVWLTECIARVDPSTGAVRGWIMLNGLRDQMLKSSRTGHEDVLNGIAWDVKRRRIFVTGKYWSQLFHIELKKVEMPHELDIARARANCVPRNPHILGLL